MTLQSTFSINYLHFVLRSAVLHPFYHMQSYFMITSHFQPISVAKLMRDAIWNHHVHAQKRTPRDGHQHFALWLDLIAVDHGYT